MIRNSRSLFVAALSLTLASVALAQSKPVAPALDSNLGAKYSIYLDFSGFNYPGTWGGGTPGNVPAYNTDGNASTFNAAETQAIKDTWARFANAYRGFNVNVTTVDPAAAGSTDAQRKTFYDQKQYFMHTIFGGRYDWFGAAGGVSYVGTAQDANVFSGGHTNWVFPENGSGTSAKGMAAAGIHEDGHGLKLNHQSDETTNGAYSDNNGASGNGSYSPIMGTTYVSQRGTWRVGSAAKGNANDVAVLQSNNDIGPLLDDGIGHTFDTATSLAVTGGGLVDVNSSSTKGFIMPKASTGYSAGTGVGDSEAYTKDYFTFSAKGGLVTLTANDGNDLLTKGVADPGATMRCVMNVYTSTGSLVGTATTDSTTLKHTFSGTLTRGRYVAEILSYGAYISSYESNARYFNMGGYFLTGSGIEAVPEPATMVALGLGAAALMRRRRKSA